MADAFDAIARHASERPNACALLAPNETISYAQYETAFHMAAENIRAWGIRPGAVAGIAAYQSLDYVLLLMGLMRAGAIACPMSPRWPMPIGQIRSMARIVSSLLPSSRRIRGDGSIAVPA